MRVAVSLVAGGEADARARLGRGARPTAVVVDVLRATTTLTVALANGARAVEAFAGTAEALARRDATPGMLACGERDDRIVPGFDLGNSPFEFTPERVGGRALAFASTNGSLALLGAAGCERRLLGAFVNAGAVLARLHAVRPECVLVACAGKEGAFALEDAAFAGWLCTALAADGATLADPAARFAAALAPADAAAARAVVEGAAHARWLRGLGPEYVRDVAFCATLDALDRVFEV